MEASRAVPAIGRAALALLAAIALFAMLDRFVRDTLYPAPSVSVPSPPPPPLEEVVLAGAGGTVHGWWLPPPSASAPRLLMLHGNGENLETMRRAGLFVDFARLGVGVLAIDYPGYGRSPGRPSQDATVAAAGLAWRWLDGVPGDGPRLLVGWSLGAAVAVQAAADREVAVDGLVLISPWDRLEEVARLHFPAFLVGLALPDRYDSAAAAPRVRAPSLVIHGERDAIIPAARGRAMFAALPDPKRWVEIPGAGHNDLLARDEVWRELEGFLDALRANPR